MCLHDDNLNQVQPYESATTSQHKFFKICRLMADPSAVARKAMKLNCIQDSRSLKSNSNNRISSAACSKAHLANGTFEGGIIVHDIEDPENTRLIGEYSLTGSDDGITNCLAFSKDERRLFVASNDVTTRVMDLEKMRVAIKSRTPFAVNSLSVNPQNPNLATLVGDNVDALIVDYRCLQKNSLRTSSVLKGHKDYGFACDWNPANENLVVSGNQDGTVRLWDTRMTNEAAYCWNSAAGSQIHQMNPTALGGPVRNCKFTRQGDYVVWAETLDHVGIVPISDLLSNRPQKHLSIQSIDFIGKCIGLNVCASDSGEEQLVIGVNDHPLSGILTYKLERPLKLPHFDLTF